MPSLHESPLFVRARLADFDVPTPTHLVPAVLVLLSLGYGDHAIEAIRSHLARHGPTEGCAAIDPEHRGMVESQLDSDPAWNGPEWDEIRFGITTA